MDDDNNDVKRRPRVAFELGTPMFKRSLGVAPCLSLAQASENTTTAMYSKESGVVGAKLKVSIVVDFMNEESQHGARECDLPVLLAMNHV